ncbi:hypothetical protein PAXRUDRAFT_15202 [Paxillus rubicundulus Ve08.2h10]|uniref:Uncharacterized protein n=1 Tax=Paxillus rubicundulus Ve08.2h10 TaxID=930991 RepID=A0A0D0D0L5_9AGAM|nr:hypothetical protein PAXRUDRAFT_15202 [Paxillus rubicundulus Ve08.2h10]
MLQGLAKRAQESDDTRDRIGKRKRARYTADTQPEDFNENAPLDDHIPHKPSSPPQDPPGGDLPLPSPSPPSSPHSPHHPPARSLSPPPPDPLPDKEPSPPPNPAPSLPPPQQCILYN